MLVDLYKNNNTASKTYGQYYGRVFPRDGLNLKGFAKHLSEHGKLASYEMLVLVLQNIVDCMRHLLLEGVPIKPPFTRRLLFLLNFATENLTRQSSIFKIVTD